MRRLAWCAVIATIFTVARWFHTEPRLWSVDPASPVGEATNSPAEAALSLAVRHLDQGELREAITPLQLYLKYHPAAADVRLQLAECLFRTNQPQAARLHYELLWPQAINRPATREQVQLQTRLMQCAAADGDEAGEPYHRALGLWWLVASWDADPARRDEILAEQTLAEALDALREAENVTGPQITTQSLRRQILQRLGLPQPDLNRDR